MGRRSLAALARERFHDRRGYMRDVVFLLTLLLCLGTIYLITRGDAASMVEEFIRRVRNMGQP
jgi:hypothetical protein